MSPELLAKLATIRKAKLPARRARLAAQVAEVQRRAEKFSLQMQKTAELAKTTQDEVHGLRARGRDASVSVGTLIDVRDGVELAMGGLRASIRRVSLLRERLDDAEEERRQAAIALRRAEARCDGIDAAAVKLRRQQNSRKAERVAEEEVSARRGLPR